MSDAKVLTTADAMAMPEHGDEDGGMPGVVLVDRDDLLATTRALETARAALVDVHDALHRECAGKADIPGEIRALRARAEEAARALEIAQTVEADLESHVSRAYASLDAIGARAEKAERERDEARDRVSALETALLDACREKVVHGHTTTLLSEAKELRVAGIEQLFLDADQIRDEAKTLVSELVTALTGLERRFLDPKPGDPGGSCWCDPHRYLELQGHEDECEVARAALAKAKGTK